MNHNNLPLSHTNQNLVLTTLSIFNYIVIMYLVKSLNRALFTAIIIIKEAGKSGSGPGGLAMLMDGGRGMVVPATDYG
jgi:hypothetical protein